MSTTKLELSTKISKKLSRPTTEVKAIVDGFLDELFIALAEGERIEIRGFGVFKTKVRKPRLGRNPRTGEAVPVPSYVAPVFKFSKDGQRAFDEKLMQVQDKTSVPAYSSKGKKRKVTKATMTSKPASAQSTPAVSPAPTITAKGSEQTPVASTARSAENFSPV